MRSPPRTFKDDPFGKRVLEPSSSGTSIFPYGESLAAVRVGQQTCKDLTLPHCRSFVSSSSPPPQTVEDCVIKRDGTCVCVFASINRSISGVLGPEKRTLILVKHCDVLPSAHCGRFRHIL